LTRYKLYRLLVLKTVKGFDNVNFLLSFLITAFITGISLVLISKIPVLGVEIDSFNKAVISGIVFGFLNAILGPILFFLSFPFIIITFGLFLFILNAIIFGLTARIVTGFRLRNGIWSAILGAIALSIVNSILFTLLRQFGIIATS